MSVYGVYAGLVWRARMDLYTQIGGGARARVGYIENLFRWEPQGKFAAVSSMCRLKGPGGPGDAQLR